MLEILESPSNVVACRITGRLTTDEYDRVIERVEATLARHERIGLVVDVTAFSDADPEVVAKDFRYGMSKIGEWRRFERTAVVTDKRWLGGLAAMADRLLPRNKVRAFEPGRLDDAFAWAAGLS